MRKRRSLLQIEISISRKRKLGAVSASDMSKSMESLTSAIMSNFVELINLEKAGLLNGAGFPSFLTSPIRK